MRSIFLRSDFGVNNGFLCIAWCGVIGSNSLDVVVNELFNFCIGVIWCTVADINTAE